MVRQEIITLMISIILNIILAFQIKFSHRKRITHCVHIKEIKILSERKNIFQTFQNVKPLKCIQAYLYQRPHLVFKIKIAALYICIKTCISLQFAFCLNFKVCKYIQVNLYQEPYLFSKHNDSYVYYIKACMALFTFDTFVHRVQEFITRRWSPRIKKPSFQPRISQIWRSGTQRIVHWNRLLQILLQFQVLGTDILYMH